MTTGTRAARVPVVLLAHGSRHVDGTASVERLRAAVAAESGVDARAAYLDLNQPDLTAAARTLRADGYPRAVVVPLLFTPAFHARTDVPGAVAAATSATGVDLRVAEILGAGDDLAEVLTDAARAAGIPDRGDLAVVSVGSSRPEANATITELADRLSRRRAAVVRAAFATCPPHIDTVLVDQPATVGVLSLFVGHGRLLDTVAAAAAARGIPVTPPLETALAPLVLQRYAAAC